MAFQFFQIQSWNTMAEAKSSFVREHDIDKIPKDFCSELRKARNHRKPIPTVMEVKS